MAEKASRPPVESAVPISWPCRPPSGSRLAPDHDSCHGVVMSTEGAGMVRCGCPVCDHPQPDLEKLRRLREQRW